MKSGRIFDGEWERNMPHGHIVETTADGDVYDGAFVNGQRSGQGKLSLKSGRIYEGEFVENSPNG